MILIKNIGIIGIESLPIIKPGDDVAALILAALDRENFSLRNGDILLLAQSIISKSIGMIRDLKEIRPSKKAIQIYNEITPKAKSKGIPEKSPELIEYILRESKNVLKSEHVLITETIHGFICANAGIDKSNVEGETKITLLPLNSDKEANIIREKLKKKLNVDIAVIITDSFGRPFRKGSIGIAIGVSGMEPLLDKRGEKDLFGHQLQSTVIAQVDSLASAAQLMMGESNEGIPAVIIRGYEFTTTTKASINALLREEEDDLFRKDVFFSIDEFLKNRRSYKFRFAPMNISPKLLHKCIEIARWAPSAHNAQPWRYIIINNSEKRQELISQMNEKLKTDLESDGKSQTFILNKVNKTKNIFLEAPCLILSCLDEKVLEKYNDKDRTEKEFIMGIQSVSSSITYLLLSLHSNKLAACWYCAPLFSPEIVKKCLNLPRSYTPLAFITVGYPEKYQKPPPRKQLNEIIFNMKE